MGAADRQRVPENLLKKRREEKGGRPKERRSGPHAKNVQEI